MKKDFWIKKLSTYGGTTRVECFYLGVNYINHKKKFGLTGTPRKSIKPITAVNASSPVSGSSRYSVKKVNIHVIKFVSAVIYTTL